MKLILFLLLAGAVLHISAFEVPKYRKVNDPGNLYLQFKTRVSYIEIRNDALRQGVLQGEAKLKAIENELTINAAELEKARKYAEYEYFQASRSNFDTVLYHATWFRNSIKNWLLFVEYYLIKDHQQGMNDLQSIMKLYKLYRECPCGSMDSLLQFSSNKIIMENLKKFKQENLIDAAVYNSMRAELMDKDAIAKSVNFSLNGEYYMMLELRDNYSKYVKKYKTEKQTRELVVHYVSNIKKIKSFSKLANNYRNIFCDSIVQGKNPIPEMQKLTTAKEWEIMDKIFYYTKLYEKITEILNQ